MLGPGEKCAGLFLPRALHWRGSAPYSCTARQCLGIPAIPLSQNTLEILLPALCNVTDQDSRTHRKTARKPPSSVVINLGGSAELLVCTPSPIQARLSVRTSIGGTARTVPAHIPVLPHIPSGAGAELGSAARRAEGFEHRGEDGDVSEVSREPAEGKGRELQKGKRLAKNFQLSHRNSCLQPLHAQEVKFTRWLLLPEKTAQSASGVT